MKKQEIEKIVDNILRGEELILSPSTLNDIRSCQKADLIQYHSGIGMAIRNAYNLWKVKWKPKIVNGVDMSPDHPDQVSMKIIERLWEKLQ